MPTSVAANESAVLATPKSTNQSTESLDNLDESELIDPLKMSKLPGGKKKKKKAKKKNGTKVRLYWCYTIHL